LEAEEGGRAGLLGFRAYHPVLAVNVARARATRRRAGLRFDSGARGGRRTAGNPAQHRSVSIIMFYNPQTAVTTHTRNVQYWLAHDERAFQWLVEVIVRKPTGILYLVHRYDGERPGRAKLYRDALKYGHFSRRPYQLAQACDGSINCCVLALFSSF